MISLKDFDYFANHLGQDLCHAQDLGRFEGPGGRPADIEVILGLDRTGSLKGAKVDFQLDTQRLQRIFLWYHDYPFGYRNPAEILLAVDHDPVTWMMFSGAC